MLKIGIIGMGKMGGIRAREIEANPNTQISAVYDIDQEGTKAHAGVLHAKACETVEDLLDLDLDAVFICTFNDVAPVYTKAALRAGKHVFCEKPPARTVAELKTVREVEAETGLILKYGFNHRYHHSVMEARKLLDNRVFGKLLWLRGVYGKAGGNQFTANWRNKKEVSGGGILIDQGIHMVDLLTWFAGDFTDVQSLVQTRFWDVPVEDNVFAILKTADNVSAALHSSATQWRHKFLLEMCFEDGYINLDGILSSTRSYGDECLVIARKQFEDTTFAIGKPREERIYFDRDESWRLELEEFVDAVQNKQPIRNGSSAEAQRVMSLLERIYQADRDRTVEGAP